jgi:hypothetical protein
MGILTRLPTVIKCTLELRENPCPQESSLYLSLARSLSVATLMIAAMTPARLHDVAQTSAAVAHLLTALPCAQTMLQLEEIDPFTLSHPAIALITWLHLSDMMAGSMRSNSAL